MSITHQGCKCSACSAPRAGLGQDVTGATCNTAPAAAAAVPTYASVREGVESFAATVRFNKLRNGEPALGWMIVRIDKQNILGGPFNTILINNRPSLIHTSAVDASNEADRLAKIEPGSTFIVFEAKVAVRMPVGKVEVMEL